MPGRRSIRANSLLAALMAAALMSPAAVAQGTLQPGRPSAAAKLNLTMEQRYIIKEIIKDKKIPDASAPEMNVGDRVPQSVALQPMPPEIAAKVSQVKSHRFFLSDGKIIIVAPNDDRVIEVIE